VEYLVIHDACINKVNKDSEIPLFQAIESENKDLIEYLVIHDAYINKKKKKKNKEW